jgi:hypothetical protein
MRHADQVGALEIDVQLSRRGLFGPTPGMLD